MCSVWKMSIVLGEHYTGYQRKRGRPKITWRDTIMKDISQMNADGICQTAMNRQEWRVGTTQCASLWEVLVI